MKVKNDEIVYDIPNYPNAGEFVINLFLAYHKQTIAEIIDIAVQESSTEELHLALSEIRQMIKADELPLEDIKEASYRTFESIDDCKAWLKEIETCLSQKLTSK